MKVIQYQSEVKTLKAENLSQLADFLDRIAKDKPDLVMAGEMFTCPYDIEKFRVYSEPHGGFSFSFLAKLAKKHGIYLVAGSLIELDDQGRIYNTCYVFNRSGAMICKHRKVHLFDIAIQGGQHFQESAVLTPGDQVSVFETEFGKMGLCICYDIRFNEIFRLMSNQGVQAILIPAAFNPTTGPIHWRVLL